MKVLIEDILIWQKITFDLLSLDVNLKQIKQLQFIFGSRDNKGELTIDSVKCSSIIESNAEDFE